RCRAPLMAAHDRVGGIEGCRGRRRRAVALLQARLWRASNSPCRKASRPYVSAGTCRESVRRGRWRHRPQPPIYRAYAPPETVREPFWRRSRTDDKPLAPSSRWQRLAALVADRVAHTAGSLARSSIASSALIGTNNFLPILMTGSSPRLTAS